MAHLNKQEKDLIRLFALGEQLSEENHHVVQDLLNRVADARDELHKHKRFSQLMAEGKHEVVDAAGFADETMRRIAAAPAPRAAAPRHIPQKRFSLPVWIWPQTFAPRLAYFTIIVALGVGYFFLLKPQQIAVPSGEQRVVMLADLTEVTLSSGSSMRVMPTMLRSQRKVLLEGEAYFDVHPDSKPFVVETFNTIVTVLGTEFNVRAHPNTIDQKTEVSVQEGRVAVAAIEQATQTVHLTAGQGTRVRGIASAPEPRQPVAMEQVLNWQSGGFSFDNEPLLAVLEELERRFAVSFSAPSHLHTLQFSYFNNTPAAADEILEAICESLNLKYQKTSQGYKITEYR